MPFLETAIKILLILGIIFFLVFSYICLIWTGRKETIRNTLGAAVVSLLYTFKIFLLAFFLLLIASFLLDKF